MKTVTINKKELLEILTKNKVTHVDEYDESIVDYTDAVLSISESNLKLAKTGNIETFNDIQSVPSAPVSYEQDYNKSIRMLELSVDENIELSEHEFSQLVLDEWNWKHEFNLSNTMYKSFNS